MSAVDPTLRRATWLVLAGIVAIPVAVLVTAGVPTSARPPVFLVGIVVVSALSLAGGIGGRRALLTDTPHQVRAIAVSWVGLLLGVTAGVFCLWAAIGLLA